MGAMVGGPSIHENLEDCCPGDTFLSLSLTLSLTFSNFHLDPWGPGAPQGSSNFRLKPLGPSALGKRSPGTQGSVLRKFSESSWKEKVGEAGRSWEKVGGSLRKLEQV